MPDHITSVIEIREAGILLAARGKHVVRVLGALKEAPLPSVGGAKEDMSPRAPRSVYDSYYSGGLSGPQDSAQESLNPRVPALFITRTGEALFLLRDPAGEIPPEQTET
jgi:hypothetical protein